MLVSCCKKSKYVLLFFDGRPFVRDFEFKNYLVRHVHLFPHQAKPLQRKCQGGRKTCNGKVTSRWQLQRWSSTAAAAGGDQGPRPEITFCLAAAVYYPPVLTPTTSTIFPWDPQSLPASFELGAINPLRHDVWRQRSVQSFFFSKIHKCGWMPRNPLSLKEISGCLQRGEGEGGIFTKGSFVQRIDHRPVCTDFKDLSFLQPSQK